MKDPAFVLMLIASFFVVELSAQKTNWNHVSLAEHLSVKFPAANERKIEVVEFFSVSHGNKDYTAFKGSDFNSDSMISFTAFSDTLSKIMGSCAKVVSTNKVMNNDSISFLDLIIEDSSLKKKGDQMKISYLRIFEYENNLFALVYSGNSEKIDKTVFAENLFFTSIVYKPQISSRKRGVNNSTALRFAIYIGCQIW